MKKLGKLNINVEKLIKSEDLQKLRGGQQVDCAIYYDGHYQGVRQFLCYDSQEQCDQLCASAYSNHQNPWCFCNIGY
jgi:hypothetical protein